MASLNLNPRHLVTFGIVLVILAFGIAPVAAEGSQFIVYTTPTGASVCFDNHCGYSSGDTYPEPAYTSHTITVSMPGYQTWSSYENVGGPGTRVVNANLVVNPPSFGYLAINPFGADIYVDDIYYGNGEQSIPLAPGYHDLVLKKAGYYDYTGQITIEDGKTFSHNPGMTPLPASSPFGTLTVQSVPPGAAVFLNGDYQGTTYPNDPVYITQLNPGTYTVVLTLPDYQSFSQNAVIQANGVSEISATMVPVNAGPADTTGQITVGSIPGGAGVYLDNKYSGITPMVLANIAQGSHSITLRQSGYQDWISTVTVTPGSYADVSGKLTPGSSPTPTTKAAPSLMIVLAGVGICGALVLVRKRG